MTSYAKIDDRNAMGRPICFYYRGRVVEVRDRVDRTILEWLRETAHRTGTKEGCAEGDCGACTVLVGELPDTDAERDREANSFSLIGGLMLRPVNACMKFLPTLDGCALLTVEDLETFGQDGEVGGAPAGLHPVQEALVECHGSQCGFCTPGFAMSLAATYERHLEAGTTATREELAHDLAGNLCRCTGYRPILEAGARMFELPKRRLDTKPIVRVLQKLKRQPGEVYRADEARYWAPKSLEEFASIRAANPNVRILAGATDIALWVNKQMRDVGDLLYIGNVRELKDIGVVDGVLVIGAAVRLEDAWRAIVAQWPELRDIWLRFASPPVRHAGTLVGNIANGSPIGDAPPILIALQARLMLRCGEKERETSLENFYLDYMKNDLRPGEFIKAVHIPLPGGRRVTRAYKVSKRFDSDISAVCAAYSLDFDPDGVVAAARFAFGGMAAIAKRAAAAEAAVVGRPWSKQTLDAARKAVASDFTPLTDLRGSADYRWSVVDGLFQRFWLETRSGDATPLPPQQTTVFAATGRA